MKVSLKEVGRPSSGKPERAPAAGPDSNATAVDASEVRDRLLSGAYGERLQARAVEAEEGES